MKSEIIKRTKKSIAHLSKELQFCAFKIKDQLFGVNILSVKEINENLDFTKIHHTPKEIRGYVNVRGNIYLIFDMRVLLGHKAKKELNEDTKILLFNDHIGESFGILVDKIQDIVSIDEKQLEMNIEKNVGEFQKGNIIAGTCKLKNKLMTIINPKVILNEII